MSVSINARRDEMNDDVVVTVQVMGSDDAYRLLWVLLNAQVEFSALAQGPHGFRWLRRALGASWFDDLDSRLTGGKAKRFATGEKP